MATEPMQKMNKSQKKKLKRLEARQRYYDELCKKISGFQAGNKRPGAVK